MRRIIVYLLGHKKEDGRLKFISDNLKKYFEIVIRKIKEIDIYETKKKDIFLIVGFIRGSDILLKKCINEKLPYIHIDNSYFGKFFDNKIVYRLIPSFNHPSNILNIDGNYLSRFNIVLNKWRKINNGHVLVIPITFELKNIFKKEKWLEQTLSEIRKYTNREIIVRERPKELIFNINNGKINGNILKYNNVNLLENDFKNCWCVVCYDSSVGIKALINGIPVICDKSAPYKQACSTNISSLEDPFYGDRERVLNIIASYCFFESEILQENLLKRIF